MRKGAQTARRQKAWALAVLLSLVFVLVLLFTLAETDHTCAGADCAICLQLRRLQALLHLVSAALAVLFAVAVRLPPPHPAPHPQPVFLRYTTPVDLRTRLND